MTYPLRSAAETLRRTGEALGDAAAATTALDPGPRAFGADGPGALGAVGRDLHGLFQRALQARAREAAAHGARLTTVADGVAQAAGHYADVDARSRRPDMP
jgi:hypothetical protein